MSGDPATRSTACAARTTPAASAGARGHGATRSVTAASASEPAARIADLDTARRVDRAGEKRQSRQPDRDEQAEPQPEPRASREREQPQHDEPQAERRTQRRAAAVLDVGEPVGQRLGVVGRPARRAHRPPLHLVRDLEVEPAQHRRRVVGDRDHPVAAGRARGEQAMPRLAAEGGARGQELGFPCRWRGEHDHQEALLARNQRQSGTRSAPRRPRANACCTARSIRPLQRSAVARAATVSTRPEPSAAIAAAWCERPRTPTYAVVRHPRPDGLAEQAWHEIGRRVVGPLRQCLSQSAIWPSGPSRSLGRSSSYTRVDTRAPWLMSRYV